MAAMVPPSTDPALMMTLGPPTMLMARVPPALIVPVLVLVTEPPACSLIARPTPAKMRPELTTAPTPPAMSTPPDGLDMTAPKALVTVPPADRPTPVDASSIWPKLFTMVGLVAPAIPTPVALIVPVSG